MKGRPEICVTAPVPASRFGCMLAPTPKECRPSRAASGPATVQSRFRVCMICCGPTVKARRLCFGCWVVGRQLGGDLAPVVPVSLVTPGTTLHRLLVGYKAAPSSSGRALQRQRLALVLQTFLYLHAPCLAGVRGRALAIVPVPSSTLGRPSWAGEHPLVGLVADALQGPSCEIAGLEGTSVTIELLPVLERSGSAMAHLHADTYGFRLRNGTQAMKGRSVVVLDDTYTSGARSQSAAAAIARAGAVVTAVVPIGRLLQPGFDPASALFWNDQVSLAARWTRCAASGLPNAHGSSSLPRRRVATASPIAPIPIR